MNAYHVLNVHASGDIAVNVSCIINAVYVIKKIFPHDSCYQKMKPVLNSR